MKPYKCTHKKTGQVVFTEGELCATGSLWLGDEKDKDYLHEYQWTFSPLPFMPVLIPNVQVAERGKGKSDWRGSYTIIYDDEDDIFVTVDKEKNTKMWLHSQFSYRLIPDKPPIQWITEEEVKKAAEGTWADALLCSIKKWEQLASATDKELEEREEDYSIGEMCALCEKSGFPNCSSCIIYKKTNKFRCAYTPFQEANNHRSNGDWPAFRQAAQEEVEFLKSLLPDVEQLIEIDSKKYDLDKVRERIRELEPVEEE